MDLATQLEGFESRVHHAYKDRLGYLTIGVGFLIDERKGGGLFDEEIDFILANRLRRLRDRLRGAVPWYVGLSPPRAAVLEGMAYQMGVDGLLTFTRTLRAVEAGRYEDAADYMLQSRWARQTPRRATYLALQMEKGKWVDPFTGEYVE